MLVNGLRPADTYSVLVRPRDLVATNVDTYPSANEIVCILRYIQRAHPVDGTIIIKLDDRSAVEGNSEVSANRNVYVEATAPVERVVSLNLYGATVIRRPDLHGARPMRTLDLGVGRSS